LSTRCARRCPQKGPRERKAETEAAICDLLEQGFAVTKHCDTEQQRVEHHIGMGFVACARDSELALEQVGRLPRLPKHGVQLVGEVGAEHGRRRRLVEGLVYPSGRHAVSFWRAGAAAGCDALRTFGKRILETTLFHTFLKPNLSRTYFPHLGLVE